MSKSLIHAAEQFFNEALERLRGIMAPQREALDRAAGLCTEAIAQNGLVHLFGCGHSRMMCEEMTPRQGCFVGWHTIVELALTYHNPIVGPNGLRQSLHLEKTPGYAEQILQGRIADGQTVHVGVGEGSLIIGAEPVAKAAE